MRTRIISATMATFATMIMIPDNHRHGVAVTVVTTDLGPPITVAIVATVAPTPSRLPSPKKDPQIVLRTAEGKVTDFPSAGVGDHRPQTRDYRPGRAHKNGDIFMSLAKRITHDTQHPLGEPTILCEPELKSIIVGYYEFVEFAASRDLHREMHLENERRNHYGQR